MNETINDSPQIKYKTRSKLKTFMFAAILLLSGIIIGSGLTIKFIVHRVEAMIVNPDLRYELLSNRMKRKLNLTEEQTLAVETILKSTQTDLLEIRIKTVPMIDQELREMRQEIATVLTPEQESQWGKLFDYHYNKWFKPIKDRASQNNEQVDTQE